MNKFESFFDKLKAEFSEFPGCVSIENRSEFFVVDYKSNSCIVASIDPAGHAMITQDGKMFQLSVIDSEKRFRIANSKTAAVVPVDGKNSLFGFGTTCCDFILFDNNDCCFVEMKLNATSVEENAVKKNRGKAVGQLAATIEEFDKRFSKNYCGLQLEAYVSTPPTYPRENTAWRSLEVGFLEKYGVPLYEKNEKICN